MQVNRVGEREFSKKVIVGEYITVSEVLSILEKERVFTEKSGGGVTFSGGEPLMQHEFLLEALKACKSDGFHTTVDTSGYCRPEVLLKVIPFTDLFLFDLKHLDPSLHEDYTGVPNRLVLENLATLIGSSADIMLRIPVIPGYNDDDAHLASLKMFIGGIRRERIKMISLLPYHRIGASKYRKFGRENLMEGTRPPSQERMKELKRFFSETGIKVKIGG